MSTRNYPHANFPSNEVHDINREIRQINRQIEELQQRIDYLETKKAEIKRFGEPKPQAALLRNLWNIGK